jgi:hypothetical protein
MAVATRRSAAPLIRGVISKGRSAIAAVSSALLLILKKNVLSISDESPKSTVRHIIAAVALPAGAAPRGGWTNYYKGTACLGSVVGFAVRASRGVLREDCAVSISESHRRWRGKRVFRVLWKFSSSFHFQK